MTGGMRRGDDAGGDGVVEAMRREGRSRAQSQ